MEEVQIQAGFRPTLGPDQAISSESLDLGKNQKKSRQEQFLRSTTFLTYLYVGKRKGESAMLRSPRLGVSNLQIASDLIGSHNVRIPKPIFSGRATQRSEREVRVHILFVRFWQQDRLQSRRFLVVGGGRGDDGFVTRRAGRVRDGSGSQKNSSTARFA